MAAGELKKFAWSKPDIEGISPGKRRVNALKIRIRTLTYFLKFLALQNSLLHRRLHTAMTTSYAYTRLARL